jgi:hypothetical protein
MAARKATGRKKSTRRVSGRRGGSLARLEHELPPTLREYSKQMRRLLNQLEKEVEKTQMQARKRVARLLREASHRLGKLEANGEAGWRKLTAPYRRELVKQLHRLEHTVAPPAGRRTARKAGARKAAARGRSKAPTPVASADSGSRSGIAREPAPAPGG